MSSFVSEEGKSSGKAIAPLILIVGILLLSLVIPLSYRSAPNDIRESPATILANPNPNQTLIFHMHYDNVSEQPPSQDLRDNMSTNGPYMPAATDYDNDGQWGITLERQAPKNIVDFIMVPSAAAELRIKGNISFNYWASSKTDGWSMQLTMTLYDSADQTPGGDTQIGTATITESFLTSWTLHNISMPSITYNLSANHSLILDLNRANVGGGNHPLYIDYDTNLMDSTVLIPTISHMNITDYCSHGFDGLPRTEFGNQETIWAFANVTDAVGVYDIKSTTLLIKNATTNTTIVSESMVVNSSGPATLPAWNHYSESFGPIMAGNYTINITATDNSGNSYWVNWTIRVVAIDHFNVVASANKIEAGSEFTVTIEAVDSGDNRMKNWSGYISIESINDDTGMPISGLSNTSIFVSSADQGFVSISENFTIAPKNITIRATNGSTNGESQVITVSPGPIWNLTVDPDKVTLPAGASTQLEANATDRFSNLNTSWQPYWYLDHPSNGTLTPSGMAVQLLAILAGHVLLICKDNSSGKDFTVEVNITTSGLVSIVVTPVSGVIWESDSVSITATGYDNYGNPFGIAGAVWSSEGFAMSMLVGSGASGVLFAGMAPETGLVHVTLGAISGNASVSVICPPQGPTFGTFSNQVGYEDAPWAVDLSIYWSDPNGTGGLTWFVTGVNDSLLIIGHDIVSSSTINFIPQPNANGVDSVTFWIRDPTGYTNTKQITITVLPINDAPSFINNPPKELYVKFDLPYSFDYSYYVEDVDNPKSQLVIAADPTSDITVSGLSLTYDFPDENSGVQYFRIITVTISDGLLYDSITIKVWATSDTPPDLIHPLPDVAILEGDMNVLIFDLDNYFNDVDGDVLFYSEGFENIEVEINSTSHEVFLSAPTEWSGVTTAVFVAHDPTGAIRIDTINITVIAVNDPPVISLIPKVFVHYSVDYLLDLGLYVNDPDDDIGSLTIYTNDIVNASYSSVPTPNLRLNYPANPSGGPYAGPYTVVVHLHVVDSGGLFADISFTVEVSDNYPPVFTRSPPDIISFMEDASLGKPHSLDLSILFSDPDSGDVISFSFTGNKNVSVVIEADGWLNFSAALNWFGTEYITFNATDPHGAWLSFKVRVDVLPVNDPPVLSQIPDIDHYGGRQWSMDISEYILDVDDPDLLKIEVIVDQPTYVRAVGTTLYFDFPEDIDSVMVIIYVSDGEANSNMITFNVNIKQTITEIIPWQVIAIVLIAGIVCYFIALQILPHKLQELFLIHNDGRLIYHAGEQGDKDTDQDIVSAMFTAVQEFIKDSFKEGGESLKKLEMGDRKIVIEKGKWIYAAMIYTGWPPKSVFKHLTHFVTDVEGAYGSSIEHWDGTLKALPGIEGMSKSMLMKKYHLGDANQARKKDISSTRLGDLHAEAPDEPSKKS
jgi:hypothetical protein